MANHLESFTTSSGTQVLSIYTHTYHACMHARHKCNTNITYNIHTVTCILYGQNFYDTIFLKILNKFFCHKYNRECVRYIVLFYDQCLPVFCEN